MKTDLPKALRNASILGWLLVCDPEFRAILCRDYAAYRGMPLAEIDPDLCDAEALDYVWMRYSHVIDLWVSTQL